MPSQPVPDEPETLDLATTAVLAGLAIADWMRDALVAAGNPEIRFSQLFVFARLVQGPVPVGAIATEMGFSHQAASSLVNELERSDFIRRIPNPEDRRSRLVELTPRGLAVLEVGLAARDELLTRLAEATTPRDRDGAMKVVSHLLAMTGGADNVRIRDLGFPRRS